jgi:hypothetical protein
MPTLPQATAASLVCCSWLTPVANAPVGSCGSFSCSCHCCFNRKVYSGREGCRKTKINVKGKHVSCGTTYICNRRIVITPRPLVNLDETPANGLPVTTSER